LYTALDGSDSQAEKLWLKYNGGLLNTEKIKRNSKVYKAE